MIKLVHNTTERPPGKLPTAVSVIHDKLIELYGADIVSEEDAYTINRALVSHADKVIRGVIEGKGNERARLTINENAPVMMHHDDVMVVSPVSGESEQTQSGS